jgi:hypothetical protein
VSRDDRSDGGPIGARIEEAQDEEAVQTLA